MNTEWVHVQVCRVLWSDRDAERTAVCSVGAK